MESSIDVFINVYYDINKLNILGGVFIMDASIITNQAVKFKKARDNLIWIIIVTIINLFLIALDASFYFPFSINAPQTFYGLGSAFAAETQNNVYIGVGIIIALVIIALYLLFWFLSKRNRAFIIGALVLFGIDSIGVLLLFLSSGMDTYFIIDLVFHVWILYYLITGTMAWYKLRGISDKEIIYAIQGYPAPQETITVPVEAQEYQDLQVQNEDVIDDSVNAYTNNDEE